MQDFHIWRELLHYVVKKPIITINTCGLNEIRQLNLRNILKGDLPVTKVKYGAETLTLVTHWVLYKEEWKIKSYFWVSSFIDRNRSFCIIYIKTTFWTLNLVKLCSDNYCKALWSLWLFYGSETRFSKWNSCVIFGSKQ